MRRLIVVCSAVVCGMAVTMPAAAATRAAGAKAGGRDLTIAAPQTVYLAAPPYVDPDGIIMVSYGGTATLRQVRDHATAVNPEVSPRPIRPDRGYRWVGVKLTLTNTGSQTSTFPVPVMTGTDGQKYYGSDATMPGCDQLATFPPRPMDPGQSVTACDTYQLPAKVSPTLLTLSIGFTNPAASGFWQVLGGPLPRPRFPLTYAALGDSYSSGEGAGDYDTTNPESCHRSADAWPRLMASALAQVIRSMKPRALIACSGATSQALAGHAAPQPDQLRELGALSPRATLSTITMGGNDIKFPGILANCVLTLGKCIADGRLAEAENDIEQEQPILAADYREVHAADKRATILVVGYPRLFPLSEDQVQLRCRGWLTNPVRDSLDQLDADLNAVVHAAAAEDGLGFVDVTNALNGHEGCTSGSWMYPIVRPFQQQSGHPTKLGQEAIAAIVAAYLRHL